LKDQEILKRGDGRCEKEVERATRRVAPTGVGTGAYPYAAGQKTPESIPAIWSLKSEVWGLESSV